MTEQKINEKSFPSIHSSWMFRDVPGTSQLLSIDTAMGIFVHGNGDIRCGRRWILLLRFIQYFGQWNLSQFDSGF